MPEGPAALEGRCACGEVRYRLAGRPFAVHCCHCRDCQRETGSAFVINGLIETPPVEVAEGEPESVLTPSASGKGQTIVRCPTCKVALWSHYGGMGRKAANALEVETLGNRSPLRFRGDEIEPIAVAYLIDFELVREIVAHRSRPSVSARTEVA